MDKRTKIVATMGPSTSDEKTLTQCALEGMNIARLNFSHGDHKYHKKMLDLIRKVSVKTKKPISILQDLQGPKIRVAKMSNPELELQDDEILAISSEEITSKNKSILVDIKNIHKLVRPGQKILFDDGLIETKVENIKNNIIFAKVLNGGKLLLRKGVNLPGVDLPMSCLTPKDLKDLKFGLENSVDYVALSFVRKAEDVLELKNLIKKCKSQAKIVGKIEMRQALNNLEEIVDVCDAIMVARGDLAVEVGQAKLARIQKEIISFCNKKGKPVITATQMLESMRANPRPTRAEITDVSNAVCDGSDAVMLSGETASGQFPVESIRTMREIIIEAEKWEFIYNKHLNLESSTKTVPEAIAQSAALVAKQINAKAIVCLSTTGRTAQLISRHRPKTMLFAVTSHSETVGRIEVCWGVRTIKINSYKSLEDVTKIIENKLIEEGGLLEGDYVVMTLGVPVRSQEKTNTVRVFQLKPKAK